MKRKISLYFMTVIVLMLILFEVVFYIFIYGSGAKIKAKRI
ncbi:MULTISPECIES: hypothetical protein [Bacillus cereus group]|uniref:Uncharacterized protein n=1 Tax=Bacillus cereus VD048 TaxID=1053226 RepID=J8H0F2_BACCE|nr:MULTISPECIES: hypothetical protein [Bacillus cereus group]EJR26652.1 hypothetical protein IIG_05209 [Bacillus cereus VD048]